METKQSEQLYKFNHENSESVSEAMGITPERKDELNTIAQRVIDRENEAHTQDLDQMLNEAHATPMEAVFMAYNYGRFIQERKEKIRRFEENPLAAMLEMMRER